MSQALFYALPEDLIALVTAVESEGPLDYVETGVFSTLSVHRLKSALDIRRLGQASGDSAVTCDKYLVTLPRLPVETRLIKLTAGGVRYAIDQLINPQTITFCPAGALGKEFIIYGSVGTASTTAISSDLMKRFRKALRRQFRKVKAFYVGPEAYKAFLKGVRLTPSTQTPREFDLAF